MNVLQEVLPHMHGVVSLYNSVTHRAYYCDDDVCIKHVVGSAGSVFCRSVVQGILDAVVLDTRGVVKVGGGEGFDWGFSRFFKENHVPVFALNESMAAHFGQVGSWGATSVRSRAAFYMHGARPDRPCRIAVATLIRLLWLLCCRLQRRRCTSIGTECQRLCGCAQPSSVATTCSEASLVCCAGVEQGRPISTKKVTKRFGTARTHSHLLRSTKGLASSQVLAASARHHRPGRRVPAALEPGYLFLPQQRRSRA